MIKSNSPYYITTPFVSPSSGLTAPSYLLSIWVWNGLKASPPATANYTKTIFNPTASTGNSEVNIARLISDFIEFAPQKTNTTAVINGNNNQWVKTSVEYSTGSLGQPQITTLSFVKKNLNFGAISVLTLNGVQHSIPLSVATSTSDNPSEVQVFVDALPDYSATVSNDVVTITADVNEAQTTAVWNDGTASTMYESLNTVQVGSSGDEAPQQVVTSLMSLGYSYGNEGKNITTITDDTLIPIQDYKVNRDGVFVVPILVSETADLPITVISYPDNEINLSATALATTTSGHLVKLIWVQCNETTTDTYIEVVFNSKTTTLLIQDELKYDPVDIFFQNKEGAEQVITFFKEQKSSLSVNSSEFESDRGQPSLGNHQFVRYNVQGRKDLSLNSGFVDEEMNEVFTQLLLSERIWVYDGTDFTPLNIKSKQLSYKTQLKERLINYEINFEYSYNEINNI